MQVNRLLESQTMKYRYCVSVVALLLTTTGCSLLSRVSKESDERLLGLLSLEINTEASGLWDGSTMRAMVDLEDGKWWQEWWSSEQREPQPCKYELYRKHLHLVLFSEELIETPLHTPILRQFTITVDGKFRKRKKNTVYGPLKGNAVGREIDLSRDTVHDIEYENVRIMWSGGVRGECILDEGPAGRLLVVRR